LNPHFHIPEERLKRLPTPLLGKKEKERKREERRKEGSGEGEREGKGGKKKTKSHCYTYPIWKLKFCGDVGGME
jgi:hypothetical protein